MSTKNKADSVAAAQIANSDMLPTPRTYGVRGMMEWNALIPVEKCTVRVHFSGGTITGYGITPATFTTSNPAVCYIIENSRWFREKRIFIIE